MKLAKGPQLQAAESGGACDQLECVSHPNEASLLGPRELMCKLLLLTVQKELKSQLFHEVS